MTDKDKLRLICSCGTIWPVCELPVAVDEMSIVIHDAKCPSCNKSAKTACIYAEKRDDITIAGN
jgi:hypothetical protein